MNKFPWDCKDCPMLHTYDLSVDDLTYVCLWSKNQIDDCDRYKSAECPMEKHDEEVRADERTKVLDKVEELYKDKSSKIYSQWVEDSSNVPKPSFISSVALVNAICESLKTDNKGVEE